MNLGEINTIRPVAIYLILDDSEMPRYVGKTVHPRRREREHAREFSWVSSSRVLEWVPAGERWQDRERYWISYYKRFAVLENIARGGGSSGIKTAEARRRISEANRGRKHTAEERIRISIGLKGRHAGGFHNKGKVRTEETKRKISATIKARYAAGIHKSRLGSKHSEETKRIIGLKSKGRPPNSGSFQKGVPSPKSESCRKKIGLANTGKRRSDETKAKLRAANLGKHLSEETKRKISEANRARTRQKAVAA